MVKLKHTIKYLKIPLTGHCTKKIKNKRVDIVSGHDSIRILNELISDIDELLDIPKYSKHMEKIKTALG